MFPLIDKIRALTAPQILTEYNKYLDCFYSAGTSQFVSQIEICLRIHALISSEVSGHQ